MDSIGGYRRSKGVRMRGSPRAPAIRSVCRVDTWPPFQFPSYQEILCLSPIPFIRFLSCGLPSSYFSGCLPTCEWCCVYCRPKTAVLKFHLLIMTDSRQNGFDKFFNKNRLWIKRVTRSPAINNSLWHHG